MFSTSKTSTRIFLGFAAAMLLLIGIGTISVYRIDDINARIDTLTNNRFPKTVWANNIIDQMNLIARGLRDAALVGTPEAMAREFDKVPEARRIILDNLGKLDASVKSDKGKGILKTIKENREKFVAAQDRYMSLLKGGHRPEAVTYLLEDMTPLRDNYYQAVRDLIDYQGEMMAQSGQEAQGAAASAEQTLLTLAITALLLSMGVAFLIARGVARPLDKTITKPIVISELAITFS